MWFLQEFRHVGKKTEIEMNGLRFYPLHIAIKDFSFMMSYLTVMKYNMTNETYLAETVSSFPHAPQMSLFDIFAASVFYNWLPVIVSLIAYFPIVRVFRGIEHDSFRLVLTGISLTLTTPVFYALAYNGLQVNDISNAEIVSWGVCFLLSVGFYYVVNRSGRKQGDSIVSS